MSELWGGRFREPLDAAMRRFSTSLPFDRRRRGLAQVDRGWALPAIKI